MLDGREAQLDAMLAGLNGPQRQAVEHVDGPLLILAGPGSGKTRVVTHRAARLALSVARPHEILAVTFTNKAAREMRERIESLHVAAGMTVSTFHAFGARLLREFGDAIGFAGDFTIYDTDDRRKVLKAAIEACELNTTNWTPASVEREISLAKSAMLTAEGYAEARMDWRDRTYARIYECYDQLLTDMNAADFDDLLLRPVLMLQDHPDILETLQARYRYVLVDEYQDTNLAQYRLAQLLTASSGNLCVTGDPDQSIYAWRGADIGNILRFEDDHPEALIVRLEQNYRSTQRILSAADALIAGNERRKEKRLWTENDKGSRVAVREFDSAAQEAAWLAAEIKQHATSGGQLRDVAVFYRTNAMSRMLEEALLQLGVPYQIARGIEFYQRREIKDALAYLRVLVNPLDEVSLLRIINTPTRGIGDKTIQRLLVAARQQGNTVGECLQSVEFRQSLGRASRAVSAFMDLMASLRPALDMPINEACAHVISHSGLRAMYGNQGDIDRDPVQNLDELISAAADLSQRQPGVNLQTWLEQTALVGDVDGLQDGAGAVTLMTLHAAKGLEYPRVFIIGLEDGLLPLRRNDTVDDDGEEERRLLFVGMTRAREHLTLLRSRFRMIRGTSQRSTRSPFLDEIPRADLDWDAGSSEEFLETSDPWRRPDTQRGLPDDIEQWQAGILVRHPEHGLGRVANMDRRGGQIYVKVEFRSGPKKSYALAYSQLERVDYDEVT
ncbi:MAG: ATP-dependent helicase [Planctomycetota bacterium]|jgi:DNA helicase-2/ATP-dependent DNA helicase PcrA